MNQASDRTIAAIDIGTNSIKMVVARGGAILLDTARVTRLGEGVDAGGRLAPAATARTLDGLAEMGAAARSLGAQEVRAVGTSALRDSADRAEFVARASTLLGGAVEVISGEREAHLVYLSARRDPDLAIPAEALLVVTDSGGGSTEVVIGGAAGIDFRVSLQLGAVRLTERAGLSGAAPPSPAALDRAAALITESLAVLPRPDRPVRLVASGGTAANLAGMALGRLTPDAIHGIRLTHGELTARLDRLAALDLEARQRIPGLEPERADVIVAGCLIQLKLLEHFGVDGLTVSARGLRFGLLYALRDDA